MSNSVSYLFFIRNAFISSLLVLFSVRLSTIVRLLTTEVEFGFLDCIQGFGEDIWFLFIILFPVYILGRMIYSFNSKVSKGMVLIYLILLLFIQVGLNEYFLTVHQIVDASIFNFSLGELQKTVGLSERFSLLTVVGLIALIAVFWLSYRRLSRSKNNFVLSQHYFAIMLCALAWMFLPLYNSNKEVASGELGVESNVSLLLLHSTMSYQEPNNVSEVNRYDFKALDNSFIAGGLQDAEFPLFKKSDEYSVLSSVMEKETSAPNVVYIIVEGLSSDFVGEQASMCGNFMPFLDSLTQHSLYYPNALSTSQRTQNVLPATLSSVPNVAEGVVFQQMDYPNHYSLQGLLRKMYSTGFYCGVPLEYMNMRGFMNEHEVKRLSGKWDKQIELESKQLNSPWGIPDGGLFQQHLQELKKIKGKPFFDVLLTISTHDPYVYPKKEYYTHQVEQKAQSIKGKFKKFVEENASKLGAYAYTDNEIRTYFNKLDAATKANTVFVITGDHGSEMWNRSPISKYHVPIIIYSPRIKQPKTIKSTVSHLDIAPTIFAYLKNEYNVKLPNEVSFIGKQLLLQEKDEKRSFVFTTDQLKVKDVCFQGNFFLDYQLYKADKQFNLSKLSNKAHVDLIKKQRETYLKFSKYVLFGNHLIPNEAFANYYESNNWKLIRNQLCSINRDFEFRDVTKIGSIKRTELVNKKLRVQVTIKVENSRFKQLDSLPDLVLSKSEMKKMERKKSIYRMIRPTIVSSDKKQTTLSYVIIFDAAQLTKEQRLKSAYLYLYYKLHHSPKVIDAETVISKSK